MQHFGVKFQRGWGSLPRLLMGIGLVFGVSCQLVTAAGTLPEFAYHEVHLKFTQADGKPVTNASIYGWCRELNLIWPRRDQEFKGRNGVLWDDSFLGKTGSDG